MSRKRFHTHSVPEGTFYTLGLKWSYKQNIYTIHGLWPENAQDPVEDHWLDHIEDEFNKIKVEQYCSISSNINSIIADNLKTLNLRSNLDLYWAHDWRDDHKPNVELWRHEFINHGCRMPRDWTDIFGKHHQRSDNLDDINDYFCSGLSLFLEATKDFDEIGPEASSTEKPNMVIFFDQNWNKIIIPSHA